MTEAKNVMQNTISGIFQDAAETEKDLDDYVGEDGLIYCGKCGKSKQTRINLSGIFQKNGKDTMIVRYMCDCQKAEEERKKAEREYEEKMQRISRIKSMSLMDSKYKGACFSAYKENPNNQEPLKISKKYVENFKDMLAENQGLIFYGPVGTGKSFTAACIANALMDECVPVVMTSFVKILQNIQKDEEEKIINTLNDAKLLILDDLGTERNTDYALEKVYNIIDSRSRSALPMILTTNLDLQEMLNTTDIRYRRIYDRIFETCYPVNIPGESFRRQSAAQRFDRMKKMMEG